MDDLASIAANDEPIEASASTDVRLANAQQVPPSLPRAPQDGLASSLERRRLQSYMMLIVMDAALLLGCFALISAIYLGRSGDLAPVLQAMEAAYLLLPIYLTIALYNGTYSQRGLTDWRLSGMKAVMALVTAAALLNFVAFFAKMNAEFSRVVFSTGLVVTSLAVVFCRSLVSRALISRWGPGAANRLVIKAGGPDFTLKHAYHIDASEHGLYPDSGDPEKLDRLAKYLRNMDEVIVSSSREMRPAWAQALKGTGVHGEVIDQTSRDIGAIGVVHHDSVSVSSLLVSTGHLGIRARVAKRVFDLVISISALIVLSPIMLLTAIVIKLQDGGTVFFKQQRMGRGNQFFEIYKFRSMRDGDADGARSASKDDDRITPFGRFIRRTSIDELPQLLNVVVGDMSMVGPRPHALGSKAGAKLFWQVDQKYWQRHGLRPGITGLAQVRGFRGATDKESDLSNRLKADLEYIGGWSLLRDIQILFRTATVLIHHRAF